MSNQVIERKPNGQFAKGSSGNLGGNAQRTRHALNADTIREMHAAFRRGGRKAIETAMRNQPAVRFLEQSISMEKSPARPPEDRPRD